MKGITSFLAISTGLFIISLFALVMVQEPAIAKSNNSFVAQANNNGNQVKNQNAGIENEVQMENETATPSSKNENKGRLNGEAHRSAVASFAQSLLAIADREGGIGEQVRIIAQEQNDSKEKTAESIDAIGKRNAIKTFLIGTDYKNIGVLRSEMVKTRNRIEQLNRLVVDTQNEQDKIELQSQIQNLEKEQTSIESFISQNENQFSLFGWAVKLFQK